MNIMSVKLLIELNLCLTRNIPLNKHIKCKWESPESNVLFWPWYIYNHINKMKWEDKSHGKPLEDGLYEGHAIKREHFLQPIAEGSKTRCVFFSFFFVRLEFSARCSHLMTTKVATCFWLNAHLACALYGFSVCIYECVFTDDTLCPFCMCECFSNLTAFCVARATCSFTFPLSAADSLGWVSWRDKYISSPQSSKSFHLLSPFHTITGAPSVQICCWKSKSWAVTATGMQYYI